jgi:hypothetical protein
MVQVRKKSIQREIEAAAVALGFPRRVSYATVKREMDRYGRELDVINDHPRFRLVAALWRLMAASRNLDRRIAAARRRVAFDMRSYIIEEHKLTRKRLDEFIANDAAWKALTPKQRYSVVNAEIVRDVAKRVARNSKKGSWARAVTDYIEEKQRAKVAA